MSETQTEFSGWAKAYGAAVLFRIDSPALPERDYTLASPQYVAGVWTRAGAKVQRLATPGHSVLVGAGSIYRIIPLTEAAALVAIEREARAELKLIEPPSSMLLERGMAPRGEEEEDDAGDADYEGDEI